VYHIGTFAYGENLPVNQEKRKSRRKNDHQSKFY